MKHFNIFFSILFFIFHLSHAHNELPQDLIVLHDCPEQPIKQDPQKSQKKSNPPVIQTTSTQKAIQVSAPVSVGDLVDKITILQVKLEKIIDPEKLANICNELRLLSEVLTLQVPPSKRLLELANDLRETNRKLWDIENEIRSKEAKKEYDESFIKTARSVYINNRQRHHLKHEINLLTESGIMEEKQYTEFK